jgi:putative glutathione S-transferase
MSWAKGWRFAHLDEDATPENLPASPEHEGFTHIRQVYFESDPAYQARFSVPVLYDKVQKVIVNNESSEILRMLGTEVRVWLSGMELASG